MSAAAAAAMAAAFGMAAAFAQPPGTPGDWQQFGYDPGHRGLNPLETTLQAGNVATLHLLYKAALPGIVDSAPVFLSGVATEAGLLDLLFVTTTAGQLAALDAASGRVVWMQQPATGPRFTASAPAIDPGRQFVYSYGLEGRVHKYRVGDGGEVTGAGWPEVATLKPENEKVSPALAIATAANGHRYLYVANSGAHALDMGDYQGHITAIDLGSGAQQVWNAACSDQAVHFTLTTPDCPNVQSAVWARGGVFYDADLDRIFFATGNGLFDGQQGARNWGDSVIALRPDGTGNGALPLDSWTPATFEQLDDQDLDLGSTAPALVAAPAGSRFPHLAVQSGKDGLVRLLDLDDLSGQGRPGQVGGELQVFPVPLGGEVVTAPAVWSDPATGIPWVFLANHAGISGFQLVAGAGGMPSLVLQWTRPAGGTSPVVANGLVFYVGAAGLAALSPHDGTLLWNDPAPGAAGIHWQSPIVVNGKVFVADLGGNLWAYAPAAPSTCQPDAATLCLEQQRFQVRAAWRTAAGAAGAGQAVGLSDGTGYFWFFADSNVELIVKVLDGCGVDQSYWVFAGGLTNVSVTMTVTDTSTGASRVYLNPQNTAFTPLQDTAAFAACP
jgi:outer membrane protein assembly factor BamB